MKLMRLALILTFVFMKFKFLIISSFFLLIKVNNAQSIDTLTICNGDSVLLYNTWQTQTGNYSDGTNTTTLIVNPTPSITGNFLLNGNATQTIANTYQLTQAVGNQSGSAWNSVTLDLNQPFTFNVDIFFGYNNNGADGIAFLLQQVNTSVGTSGGGLGYQGISPSFCVEFDTWRNGNNSDPTYDHIAVQKNGNLNHSSANCLVSPLGLPPNNLNIENGQWHNVIFSWDPMTFNFKVFFNGIQVINYFNNIVANIFGNNSYVYWGFTAATGGANNLQQFRVNSLDVQLSDLTICQHDTVQVNPQINSSLYTYLWSPNYNILSNNATAPFFFPDSSTTYTLEITNSYNCSSTDSFTISVEPITSNITNQTSCDFYIWPTTGQVYTSSGTYSNNSLNNLGCSHTDSLNLTINNSTSSYTTIYECDSFVWPLNGQLYLNNGIYINIDTNISGCTHTDTLNLIINNSSSNLTTSIECNSYTWPINGQTYNSSGIYINQDTNISGCIHIDTLILTINNSTSTNTIISECDSFLWPVSGQSYFNNGTYVINSINSQGCTHTDSLSLTINNSSYSSTNIAECDSYIWPVNGQSFSSSGVFFNTSINSQGCNHTDTLYLTINNSIYTQFTDTACGEYTWLGSLFTSSGTYSNILVSNSGCDSIVSLQLTIFEDSSVTEIISCDSVQWNNLWYFNDTIVTETGLTTSSPPPFSGCDSVATAIITIENSENIDISIDKNDVSCYGYNDGLANISVTGANEPYVLSWNNGQNTNSITNLSPGTYLFNILDDIGCEIDSFIVIEEANQIFLDFLAKSPICRYEESILTISISNSYSNIHTISLKDSILKSFVIDTNGVLINEGSQIILQPNFSGKVNLISTIDNNGCETIFNDSVHIEVKQLPELFINEDNICVGTPSFTLNNATPQGGNYYINDILTDYFDVENLQIDNYIIRYEYTDPISNCFNSTEDIISINESPRSDFFFTPQPTDINNPSIYFMDNSSDFITSFWHLGDGNTIYDELDFMHNYSDTGTYEVKYFITNQYGCTDSTIKNIIINPIYNTLIPTAFTPNGDGDNDEFYPSIVGAKSYNMKIYDRWGGIIYDYDNGKWDGIINEEIAPSGIYSYSIIVFDYKNKPYIYKGILSLLK